MERLTSILFVVVFLLIISCAPSRESIPGYIQTWSVDLTKYSKSGFLITPYRYMGDYNSVGFLSVVAMPDAKHVKVTTGKRDALGYIKKEWRIENLDLETIIDQLYEMARDMGADAIIDFNLTDFSENYETQSTNPVTVVGVKISGFAIKRLRARKKRE